jgi:hypothetical protein
MIWQWFTECIVGCRRFVPLPKRILTKTPLLHTTLSLLLHSFLGFIEFSSKYVKFVKLLLFFLYFYVQTSASCLTYLFQICCYFIVYVYVVTYYHSNFQSSLIFWESQLHLKELQFLWWVVRDFLRETNLWPSTVCHALYVFQSESESVSTVTIPAPPRFRQGRWPIPSQRPQSVSSL